MKELRRNRIENRTLNLNFRLLIWNSVFFSSSSSNSWFLIFLALFLAPFLIPWIVLGILDSWNPILDLLENKRALRPQSIASLPKHGRLLLSSSLNRWRTLLDLILTHLGLFLITFGWILKFLIWSSLSSLFSWISWTL